MRRSNPPLRGGNSWTKESPVLPIPSYPALCREDTTSWNDGRSRTQDPARIQEGAPGTEKQKSISKIVLEPTAGKSKADPARIQEGSPGTEKQKSVIKIVLEMRTGESGSDPARIQQGAHGTEKRKSVIEVVLQPITGKSGSDPSRRPSYRV